MKSIIYLIVPYLLLGCYQSQTADMIVHNAKIYSCDADFTIYEAMAIKDGKILELGPEREILNGYDCDNIIDAEMKSVYPGFHDAHCHFWGYAETFSEVDLNGSKSFDEVIDRIVSFSENHPDNAWIKGRGWDQSLWENSEFPTNERLNELFPDIPVAVRRVDGHAALVNQKALDLAGFTIDTKIEGGFIGIEEGKLTGLLKDNAYDSVRIHIPSLSTDNKLEYLLEAEFKLFEQGLTSINDAGISPDERVEYIDWYSDNELSIKNYSMLFPEDDNLDFAAENGIFETGNLTIRSFKIVSDGALGSRGACLIRPYSDREHEHGFLLQDHQEIESICEFAAEIEYQVNSHCIGDSANRSMMKIYAKVIQDKSDHRWKIEHAQVIHPDDFKYFEELRLVPSVQPTHCTSDMRWAEDRIGKERTKYAYAYKTLLDLAGRIALGTDFPIENISPLETFYAAITRQDKEGKPDGGFYPNETLSREEALMGITIWPAWSNFQDQEKGSLEKGKAADFVILTKDIMTVEAKEILNTYVFMTFLDGVNVYSAE